MLETVRHSDRRTKKKKKTRALVPSRWRGAGAFAGAADAQEAGVRGGGDAAGRGAEGVGFAEGAWGEEEGAAGTAEQFRIIDARHQRISWSRR